METEIPATEPCQDFLFAIFRTRRLFYAILRAMGIVIIILESVSIGSVLREISVYSPSITNGGQVATGSMSELSLSQSYYHYYLQSIPTASSSSWVSNIMSMLTAWIADYGYPAVFAAAAGET